MRNAALAAFVLVVAACGSSDDTVTLPPASSGGGAGASSTAAGASDDGGHAGSGGVATGDDSSAGAPGVTVNGDSSGSAGVAGTAGASGAAGGGVAGSAGAGGAAIAGPLTITAPAFAVDPGAELTQCIDLDVGNDAVIHVGEIKTTLDAGGYELLAWTAPAGTSPSTAWVACPGLGSDATESNGVPLVISGAAADDITFGASGAGFTFQPHQTVRVGIHAFNAAAAATPIGATVTVVPMSDASYAMEAGLMLLVDPDVSLPPNGMTALQAFFTLGPTFPGTSLLRATGLENHLGTGVSLTVAPDDKTDGTPIYPLAQPFGWSDPPAIVFTPPTPLPAMGGVGITCDWNNTTPNPVKFGEGANDELCGAVVYYAPAASPVVCATTAMLGGQTICCPGQGICAQLGF